MKKGIVLGVFLLFFACSDEPGLPPQTSSPSNNSNNGLLTLEQKQFIAEFEYKVYWRDASSEGGQSSKLKGEIGLFLDGTFSEAFPETVQGELDILNSLITDGASLVLVDTLEAADLHLFVGTWEELEVLWSDIFSIVERNNFRGYASADFDLNDLSVTGGRIYMHNQSTSLLIHEIGHIMGLGHSSAGFCQNNSNASTSFMCPSGMRQSYSKFDLGIIRTLYHPDIPNAEPFEVVEPIVRRLLQSEAIKL
ncbi:MAG: hypothetical protein AAFQ20_03320 [Bacteroidota bacterium]